MKHVLALALISSSIAAILHAQETDLKGHAPVSVSSANYRDTPRDALIRAVEGKAVVNPLPVAVRALPEPQYFIFLPGEIYESDLAYEPVCELLTPSLAEKGYLNAADKVGIIRDPDKVKLVLRLSFGMRPWRVPAVRTDRLNWRDGMEARSAGGRSLETSGGQRIFDNRAGGDDDALAAAATNASNPLSGWGGGGGGRGGASSGSAGGAPAVRPPSATGQGTGVGYDSTRTFNLIVVDAFDYQELRTKGKDARRIWTTFVASPREPNQKFSAVVNTLVRQATTHWGETTAGLQIVSDARAEVKIGDAIVVPDEP